MRITVFGGSTLKPEEPGYQEALRLGQLLGEAQHIVLTGGYMGSMEAVSRGAKETNGYVIGVTCDEIETWRPADPNPWVDKELRFPTIRERMSALIEECDAAFALPGGVGTMAEVFTMWTNMQTEISDIRPLILVGPEWRTLFAFIYENMGDFYSKRARQLIYFSDDAETAMQFLNDLTKE